MRECSQFAHDSGGLRSLGNRTDVPPTFQTKHAGCAEPITLLIRAHPVIGEVVRSAAFPWIAERGRLVALIKHGHGAANPATPRPADGPNDGPIRAVVREGLERAFCERPGIPSTA